MPIRIVLFDGQITFVEALALRFADEPDLDVEAVAVTAADAVATVESLRPGVVVLFRAPLTCTAPFTGPETPAASPPPASPLTALTRRERDVLAYLVAGWDPAAVARTLFVSPHTVRTHIRNILGKLGVHSVLEAVAVAVRNEPVHRGGSMPAPAFDGRSADDWGRSEAGVLAIRR